MASSRRVVRVSGRTWWVIGVASRTSAVNAMPVCAAVCGLLVGLLFLTTPSMTPASLAVKLRENQKNYSSRKGRSSIKQIKSRRNEARKDRYTEEMPIDVKSILDEHYDSPTETVGGLEFPLPEWFWLRGKIKDYVVGRKRETASVAATNAYEQWISKRGKFNDCVPWHKAVFLIFQGAYAYGAQTSEVARTLRCAGSYILNFRSSRKCDKSKPRWTHYLENIEECDGFKERICSILQEVEDNHSLCWRLSGTDFA